jgi:prepilin-type N-terminal cleavage/methylation domain-containing protein
MLDHPPDIGFVVKVPHRPGKYSIASGKTTKRLRLINVPELTPKSTDRARRGNTLVEILVVIAVMAMVIAMVLTAFGYAIKTVRSFQG